MTITDISDAYDKQYDDAVPLDLNIINLKFIQVLNDLDLGHWINQVIKQKFTTTTGTIKLPTNTETIILVKEEENVLSENTIYQGVLEECEYSYNFITRVLKTFNTNTEILVHYKANLTDLDYIKLPNDETFKQVILYGIASMAMKDNFIFRKIGTQAQYRDAQDIYYEELEKFKFSKVMEILKSVHSYEDIQ